MDNAEEREAIVTRHTHNGIDYTLEFEGNGEFTLSRTVDDGSWPLPSLVSSWAGVRLREVDYARFERWYEVCA